MLVNLESHGTRSVEIKGHFAFAHFTGNQFPAFFWKLHVSLPPRDYERHIQSIVDFLVMRKVDFKLPDMTFLKYYSTAIGIVHTISDVQRKPSSPMGGTIQQSILYMEMTSTVSSM